MFEVPSGVISNHALVPRGPGAHVTEPRVRFPRWERPWKTEWYGFDTCSWWKCGTRFRRSQGAGCRLIGVAGGPAILIYLSGNGHPVRMMALHERCRLSPSVASLDHGLRSNAIAQCTWSIRPPAL